jgi:AcrR family transcriptional regulator
MAAMRPTTECARRSRGQPAGLSREQVVTVALRLLEQAPYTELTLSRVAAELEVTPMALYSHVRNRDDLLVAVAERVFWTLPQDTLPHPDYRARTRAWMGAFRSHILRYPQLVRIGLTHTQRPWVPRLSGIATLSRILRGAGLHGFELSDTVEWVFTSVWGWVLSELQAIEAYGSREGWHVAAIAVIPLHASADQIELLEALSHSSKRNYDDVFEFAADRLISELTHFVDSRRERASTAVPPTRPPQRRSRARRGR